MGKNLSLKIDSLILQLQQLKAELETTEGTPNSKGTGGLRALEGILEGEKDLTEEDIRNAKISFREEL
jgi:hypothetical protein